MTTIVKKSVFAATQSSSSAELSDVVWGCPMTHAPIAALRLSVTWPDQPKRYGSRDLRRIKAGSIFRLAVVVVVLLAAAGTFLASMYFSGLLMQRVQQVQRYNEPHAQYSDVWKWQGRK